MKIYYNSKLVPKGYSGITLFPIGIFFNKSQETISNVSKNHEKIHWVQQRELFIVGLFLLMLIYSLFELSLWFLITPFVLYYIIYGLSWLYEAMKIPFDDMELYHDICFEEETYYYQDDLGYLDWRKSFSWVKFIK